MYLSLNWLKKYVDLPKDLSVDKLIYDLTMSSMEVEDVADQSKSLEKMVVGKVVELKKHPNADKLKIAMVDIGSVASESSRQGKKDSDGAKKELVQIVCGGTNLKEGMIVPVALPGAKVKWHGEGDWVELSETKIRGEKSFGMICAADEIGLLGRFPHGEMEITDLSGIEGIEAGQLLSEGLGMNDVIIEIENKTITHRPDLWNHYGAARELSAIYNLVLKPLDLYKFEDTKKLPVCDKALAGEGNKETKGLKIEIKNKELCSRYMGCMVENVKIEESPEWLKKAVSALGMRPINNIVDITNYVMMDVGQPMHAFDSELIKQKNNKAINQNNDVSIIIRKARKDEKIVTLDGEERELDESMLVITDSDKAIAIAGVMGGKDTEVSGETIGIVLEAANFDDMSVRRTTQKLGLRTEASNRFEKSLDSNLVELAIMRALKLIKEVVPEAEIKELIDENYSKKEDAKIEVGHEFLEKRIGQKFEEKEIVDILERLGFRIESRRQPSSAKVATGEEELSYFIKVPSWRATGDVSIPEDIVEEVARIYGYDFLKEKQERVDFEKAKYQLEFDLQDRVKKYLSVGCRMNEVYNYPWAEKRILERLGLSDGEMIEIDNPPAEENKYLQTSLVPNLIKNVETNLRFFDEFKLFELARIFKPEMEKFDNGDDVLPKQPKMISGVYVLNKNKDVFHELKGVVEGLPYANKYKLYANKRELNFVDKQKNVTVEIGGEEVGWFGEVSDNIYKNFDFKNKRVGLFEINFTELVRLVETQVIAPGDVVKYTPLPQYPEIERDIALELDMNVEWGLIKKSVQGFDQLIRRVEFLSVFDLEDENPTSQASARSRKSLAFRVIYRSGERTLRAKEVEEVEKKLVEKLEKETGGKLRQ